MLYVLSVPTYDSMLSVCTQNDQLQLQRNAVVHIWDHIVQWVYECAFVQPS